jgi:hypothetical protein
MRGFRLKSLAVIVGLTLAASSAAIIAAAVEIESIVVTGPIAGIVGLLLALVAALLRWRMLTAASLSLPILGVIVFLAIILNSWSPREAQTPVTVMLLAYEVLAAPLWLRGLWRITHDSPPGAAKWQVSLRSLMLLTFVVAVTLGLTRLALTFSTELLVAIAVGVFLTMLLALLWLVVQAALVESPTPKRLIEV